MNSSIDIRTRRFAYVNLVLIDNMSADQSEDSVHRRTPRNCATQGELVFGQAVFYPFPAPPPLARFVNHQPGPDLAARIRDGDLITSSGFFDPASNRLRPGYEQLGPDGI